MNSQHGVNSNPQPPNPNQNIDETKNTPDKEGVVEPRQHSSQNSINPIIPPDQNIDRTNFTAKQLIAWAEKQKEFKDSVFTKESGPEAYEQALNHLIHYVKYPIQEII